MSTVEIEGVPVHWICGSMSTQGFLVSPFDLVDCSKEVLQKINAWCAEHQKAYLALEVFTHLQCRFDEQFMQESDLDLLVESFPDSQVAQAALVEKEQLQKDHEEALSKEIVSRRKPSTPQKGYVYLLKFEGKNSYKIGKTINLEARITQFEIKLPFETQLICAIPSDDITVLEAQLHERFAQQRINGEWFKLTANDVKYIQRLSYDHVVEAVFALWNDHSFVHHRFLEESAKKAIHVKLERGYTLDDFTEAFDSYEEILQNPTHYWLTYKWTLVEFVRSPRFDAFVSGEAKQNYLSDAGKRFLQMEHQRQVGKDRWEKIMAKAQEEDITQQVVAS